MKSISIEGVDFYLPKRVIINDDLSKIVDTSEEWIRTRTGICERHFAAEAVVGGAMFGDNLSLISDTTIAATRTQGVEMRDKMLCNLKIVALPALGCACLYALCRCFQRPSPLLPTHLR